MRKSNSDDVRRATYFNEGCQLGRVLINRDVRSKHVRLYRKSSVKADMPGGPSWAIRDRESDLLG